MDITFAGYTFTFWILTIKNRYEPENFQITQTEGGIVAKADSLSFGGGAGITPGLVQITFSNHPNGFSWQVDTEHTDLIKGVRVRIRPLPLGTVIIPDGGELNLKEGDPGKVFVYPGGYYPLRHLSSTGVEPYAGPLPTWAAQFAIVRTDNQSLFLSAREYPPRVKKIWVYKKGLNQEIYLYSEANASQRSTKYVAPTWTLETVKDWRSAVMDYSQWMAEAFQIKAFNERSNVKSWFKEINLMVIFHGISHLGSIGHDFRTMAARLEDLSHLHPPSQTLVKVAGFEGNIDREWPDVDPATILGGEEGFRHLINTGHRLGYHIIPHLNVWGASYENPKTQKFLPYQIYDQEGHPSTWSFDFDQDEIAEEVFAYISPDVPEWRQDMKEKIHKLVDMGVDGIYLDQTGTFINDLHHDHYRGLRALYAELGTTFPEIQFTGEAPINELTASLVSVTCGIAILPSPQLAEMYQLLFGPYIRSYGYNLPPEPYAGVWGGPFEWERWSEDRYRSYVERSGWVNGIPSLNLTDKRIRLDSKLVELVLDEAKKYRMC